MTLRVSSLSVSRSGRRVLSDLTFDVPSHVWCGLIGVNGAGKTTLLRALAGRIPLEAGQTSLDGYGLDQPSIRAARVGLSVAPDRLPDAMRVDHLAAEVARAHGADPRPSRLDGLYHALALHELAGTRIGVLSLGQRQRVGLWLAFLGEPRVVLLDEPFNALDPLIALDLKRVLVQLASEGLTLITALHDLPTLALRCGHGLLLSQGRLAQVFDADALADARLNPSAFEADVLERWRRAEARP